MESVGDTRRRWLALAVVLLSFGMTVIDASVANVALPDIQRDLGFSPEAVTWVLNAYLVAYGALLLVAGRLGDLIGRKRVFLLGTLVFALASLAAGLASDQLVLIVARFAQGVGGAFAAAAVLAIIVAEFPAPEDRAKAMSMYMMAAVSGGSIGLLLGGVLTQAVNWHWIFIINLPIAAVTLVAGRRLIADDHALGGGEGVDVPGATVVTAALLVLVYAIVQAPEHGWGSGRTLGLLAVVLVGLIAFTAIERRVAHPILPGRILRPQLLAMSAVRGSVMLAMFGTFLMGTLYLQDVRGLGAIETGLAFLPMSVVVAICSLGATRRLISHVGPGAVIVGGLLMVVAGLLLLTRTTPDTSFAPLILVAFLLFGLGTGNAFTAVLILAVDGVPREDAGLATGILNVSAQVATAVGLAVLGTLSATRTDTLRRHGAAEPDALTGGYHLVYLVCAGVLVVGVLIALMAMRRARSAVARAVEPASA